MHINLTISIQTTQTIMIDNQPRDQMPRRHNIILKQLAIFAFWVSGWKLTGTIANTPKLLVIAAPHHSAWEVLLGFMTICRLSLGPQWMGKHTIFRWPIGYIARFFGGIAIDRRQAHGVVGETVKQFNQSEQLLIVMMPEGTRAKAGVPVEEWKKGYYYISHRAAVPVMPLYIDHANKQVNFGEAVSVDDDYEIVVKKLQAFYDNEKAKSVAKSENKT